MCILPACSDVSAKGEDGCAANENDSDQEPDALGGGYGTYVRGLPGRVTHCPLVAAASAGVDGFGAEYSAKLA